ncbi:hypothetical protein BDN71DRAFT_1500217 [Pleurotus eryngii]|uniref:Uncharacterized protein n=1 Tax=Pleurotus eryngii TaxID=5323 RepID=A0A9P6ACE1_PLEER|nr:hypothetical protein BDN71DRAFT_1500217 [Pleurotus eryngii]
MARKKNSVIAAAARMREAKVTRNQTKPNVEDSGSASDTKPDVDMCCWDGSVNHVPSSDEEPMGFDTDAEEFSDLDGEELVASIEEEMKRKGMPLPLAIIMQSAGNIEVWSSAERNRALGYNGNSKRTKQRHAQKAREKEDEDAVTRKGPSANLMRSYFGKPPTTMMTPATHSLPTDNSAEDVHSNGGIFCGYLSDNEPDDLTDDECDTPEVHRIMTVDASAQENLPTSSSWDFQVAAPPPLKRRKLDVPFRVARLEAHGERRKKVLSALKDIEKVLKSKKTEFHAGNSGLEAMRMRAIQSYLHMVVHNGRGKMDAGSRASESHGFSGGWGGRLVRMWAKNWIENRTRPTSQRGCHRKSFSLLSDPAICTELRSFVRTNKWAMDPAKLVAFSKNKLLPDAAEKYVHHIVDQEMPRGLKKYIDAELLPRLHLKVGKGISVSTARRWLRKEGFRYMAHKKGLYYDGHERPDVVDYHQNEFLPRMAEYRRRLVEFTVGEVQKEVNKAPDNFVETRLVMLAHDEMTAQSNNSKGASWVYDQEQPLKKKGVGRGLHQSDVICSTYGWLPEASQTLEYGKNYDGYWNGELFVKQLVERIIPAFEKYHGAGYKALILVDNSQGHSAYAADALLTSQMNMRPGGKQARLHDGWYIKNDYPDQPKGIKQVLLERGLWPNKGLVMQCKSTCEPDFKEQRSLVQEVIEAAGHECIFLPKFHCELNFIEFFWGAVKRYLADHCDYTFDTLKENMPKALAAVEVSTIRKWEHRMQRWMDGYREGLGAKEAQFKVREFSSTKYTSHRRIPNQVAAVFDT